jgi:hypothetical protein
MAPDQLPLVRQVADAAELSVIAAGATGRGLSQSVASELACKPLDDLRAALASTDADLFWIASPGSFGVGTSGNDATAVAEAHARGVKIATLEPIPAAALDLVGGGWLEGAVRPVDVLRFIPRARLSEPFRGATDVLDHFGQIRSMGIEMWSAASECSMGAGLYAALELILALMGEPETIDAACATPSAGQKVHALPGETLRDLHGDLTANIRLADGRAAALYISDQAGRWDRTITMLGAAGRIRIHDDGFEWIGADGKLLDHSRPPKKRPKDSPPPPPHAVTAIADSLSRLIDPAVPDPGPSNHAAILAMGQAALLSARTGQGESPATIRRMVGSD